MQRILSAAVLLPLVVVLVWWNFWGLVVLVLAACVFGLRELYDAFAQAGLQPRPAIGVALATLLLAAFVARTTLAVDLLPLALVLLVTLSLVAWLPSHALPGALVGWALTIAGALYLAGLLGFFILLRGLDTPLGPALLAPLQPQPGAAWVFLALLVTWGQDVLAYFVGRRLGRHPMAPGLSPKKTWEGAAGGMIGALAGALLALPAFGLPLSIPQALALGLVGGVVGPLGDLAESFVKRQVGLKDAGSLIPGHGGVLDRIDSALFVAPFLFFLIALMVR